MFSSIFSNPNLAHLIEICCWMLGAFLIGLFFGRLSKTKKKNTNSSNLMDYEDLSIKDNVAKIRATKTFERGGIEMIKSIPPIVYHNGLNFNRIGTASISDKNNLQEIKGIGPSIEEKLNAIGIHTFKQISNFNSKDITKVTELIKFFPGRIKRDDWVGQADNALNKTEN